MKTVTLFETIARPGGEIVREVTLDRPTAGSLRGLKLTDILQMDVAAMGRLLPRITNPALTPAEVDSLGPADLLQLSGEVVSFFVTPDQLAKLQETAQT